MALSHLSMDTESYQLFLSNSDNENRLTNPNISSAGSFELILDRTIDLSPLLYMKSTNAEVAVSHFSITNLPLTVTKDEEIKVQISIHPWLGSANRFYSPYYTRSKLNKQYHRLPLKDLITSDTDTLLNFLNRETLIPYIHFVLRSMFQVVLDDNIFSTDDTHFLSRDDIRLLSRYLNISLFTRSCLHDFLNKKLGNTDFSIDEEIKYSKDCDNYTARKEDSLLQKSKALRPLSERPATRGEHDHVIDLALFYGRDLTVIKSQSDGPKQAIETDYESSLSGLNVIRHTIPNDETSPFEQKTIDYLNNLIEANKALVTLAMKLHDLLALLVKKMNKSRNFTIDDHLLVMSEDQGTGKLQVDFKPGPYLIDKHSSVTIMFPPKLSYVLGSDSSLTIGPIKLEQPLLPDQPALTDTITNETQTTFFPLRPTPKMFHILTNIILAPTCNLWLRNTSFDTCNVIYSTPVDDASIGNRFVCKHDDSLCYHRLNTRLLTRIQFHIVDENMKPVVFAPKCHMKIGLNIRPTSTTNN